MKLYTKKGDYGRTCLLSGETVSKCDLRIEAYGDLDELNSVLGILVSVLPDSLTQVREKILLIQITLMHASTQLAASSDSSPNLDMLKKISSPEIKELENAIDFMENTLPRLKDFLIPGGHLSSAWAHLARAVCRRAERHVVRLRLESADEKTDIHTGNILIYLNRLSDYFFSLSRFLNQHHKIPDTLWKS